MEWVSAVSIVISACSRIGFVGSQITLEGMAALMGDDIHIPAGAVEVGKDKGRMEIRHVSHIAAHFFVLARQYLQKMIIQHEIEKFSGLLGELPVHFLTGQEGVS